MICLLMGLSISSSADLGPQMRKVIRKYDMHYMPNS